MNVAMQYDGQYGRQNTKICMFQLRCMLRWQIMCWI